MKKLLAALTATIVLSGCGGAETSVDVGTEPSPGPGRPASDFYILAVNEPLAYVTGRLLADDGVVSPIAPAGLDPADWQPDAEAALKMQDADLVVLNGAGYEPWLDGIAVDRSRLVTTAADLDLIQTEGVVHQHGPEGAHSHTTPASTVWLDPTLLAEQAQRIADALGKQPHIEASVLAGRQRALGQDLRELDQAWAASLAQLASPVLFSHPVYQYFEQRYGLDGVSMHWEPGAELSQKQLAELDRILADHRATIIVWESEPIASNLQHLAERGLVSVVIDPGGAGSDQYDYLTRQRQNIARMVAVLAK